MAIPRSHSLHQGERDLQERRHTPEELASSIPNFIQTDMPQQHAEFYADLSYLPLCTIDNQGRPWASILVTQSDIDPSIGINVSENNGLKLVSQMSPYDPFFRALEQTALDADAKPLFAGVGVDFSNRRRNKIAGTIDSVGFDASGKLSLGLRSDEHLGNCPKYITIRSLKAKARLPQLVLDNFNHLNEPLTDSAKELIDQASTVFLATKHVPDESDSQRSRADMGLNHRGGAPGFVRVYEEISDLKNRSSSSKHPSQVLSYLVLPDYSGNRFYQSLGNIQANQKVGLVFPDFKSGDMLFVTGEAENVFDDEADKLMPRASLVTRIRITGAVHIKEALSLDLLSEEQLSPYNPPLRYLRSEMVEAGRNDTNSFDQDPITATLLSSTSLSTSVTTFSFELSRSIEAPLPGGFGVFDFSSVLDAGYSHMDEINPQAVNEDYIRTWTLSSAPQYDAEAQKFKPINSLDVTVKHKPGGLVSSFLHDTSGLSGEGSSSALQVNFKGAGSAFTCFEQDTENAVSVIPEKMLWVAGGVGITPFMSMWDGIRNITQVSSAVDAKPLTDIVLVFGGRGDDLQLSLAVSLTVLAYQSGDSMPSELVFDVPTKSFAKSKLSIVQGRIAPQNLAAIDKVFEREVFLCGPDGLMQATHDWLEKHGDGKQRIHRESYFF